MLRKLLFAFAVLVSTATLVKSQTGAGAIKVTLKDDATKETIPFANILVEQNGTQIVVGQTDINGEVVLKPINPGKYDVKAAYAGYPPTVRTGVLVSGDKTTGLDITMKTSIDLATVVKEEYKVPLIDPDTKTGGTVTREQFLSMPSRNINSVAATTAGVYQADEGGGISIRGSRGDQTAYFVDGQKVIGNGGVPQQSIEQVTTIIGGTPAQYGDALGGVISVTTRGPQSNYFGGIEASSSYLLDDYGNYYAGFSTGGPIIMKKDTVTQSKKPVLGFIISGEVTGDKDASPSAIGYYKVNDDVLSKLEKEPLQLTASGGILKNAEFIRASDLEKIKARQNSAGRALKLNGKLDFKPTQSLNVTFGGSVAYDKGHAYVLDYSLFNPVNNPQSTALTWNVYGKLTQKFGNPNAEKKDDKSSFNLKNAFYTLQVGYTRTSSVTEDDTHKDQIFNYGHIGKFNHYKAPVYAYTKHYNPQGQVEYGFYTAAYQDTLITFEPGAYNPEASNYTTQVYGFLGPQNVSQDFQVQQNFGLLNGDRTQAQSIYGMYLGTGRQYGGYAKGDASQFRVFTTFSSDIKNHAITAGIEYEQRFERGYSVSPIGLWTLMRQLTNLQISSIDTTKPVLNTALSGSTNYYDLPRLYKGGDQKQFDKSLREKLGMAVDGLNWIDIDSYDPSTYSIDMFSASDLLNNGNSYVGYYGYDYKGKVLSSNPTLEDFFTQKDEKGNLYRPVGTFSPIYAAGFIQDKFDFKDLKFNVGVRVDRYDANQKVLKDKYLLYETKTAGDMRAQGVNVPTNIKDDYYVYANDINNPSTNGIVGYRKDDTWYNSEGTQISDPKVLASATTTGSIAPYLVRPSDISDKDKTNIPKAFTDYKPQVMIMPRIAFAFPISDVANFFAHYDLLTQRPTAGSNRLDPVTYLNWANGTTGLFIANPNLKPQRTTDYELGFRQVLSERKNSALELTAFYKEIRDLIQVVSVNYAYPSTYLTYSNIDFGTVKGFSVSYDFRRTNGIEFRTSYTLQFADGTGSSAADGFNVAASGQPNLRVPVPLDYDQRHSLVMNADYRFGAASEYRGPVIKYKEKSYRILENMGANLVLRTGSGTPYTAQAGPSATQLGGSVGSRGGLKGSINGSSLPWQFRVDLRVDKGFNLTFGKKDAEDKKPAYLNVWLQVLNVLNTQNILSVYAYSGVAYDDGWLSSAIAQPVIASQTDPESFQDLYNIRVNNPGNYSIPRRIRLGLSLSF